MLRRPQGFTLIELMIVVMIIGILASIALPSYDRYTLSAKLTEGFSIISVAQKDVEEFYRIRTRFPRDNAEAGLPAPQFLIGHYVGGVDLEDGAFHIRFRPDVLPDGREGVLTMRPLVVTGSPASPIAWLCANAAPPEGMEPVGTDRTTLQSEELPVNCR